MGLRQIGERHAYACRSPVPLRLPQTRSYATITASVAGALAALQPAPGRDTMEKSPDRLHPPEQSPLATQVSPFARKRPFCRLSLRERTPFRGAKGDIARKCFFRPRAFPSACIAIAILAGGCGQRGDAQRQPVRNGAKRAPPHTKMAAPPRSPKETVVVEPPAAPPQPANGVDVKHRENTLPPVDERRVEAHGIRKVQGDWLTLYTDLPASEEIDRLPDIFALAIPQWCRYFQVDESGLAGWQVRGCLMNDRQRFIESGLLPDDLDFTNAFAQESCVWWQDQETDYYRRHLMLHEATHAFMFHHFGDCGPGWFMEGLAELLGTHHLSDGRLTLGYFPERPDDLPFWGRIEMVQKDVQTGRALSIAEVMAYQFDVELQDRAYAWCWALAAFLDGHPRYRERFRQLPGELQNGDFNRRFLTLFQDDWQALNVEWQAFLHDLDFGYDLIRNAIDLRRGAPLENAEQSVTIAADRGWQSSGIRVEAGKQYQLTAMGRYQVANEPKVWWCEPQGVTIRYFRGRPLGMLLAMILPDNNGEVAAWRGVAIGARQKLVAETSGTLYLRINDAAAELADNAGSLEVCVDR